MKVTLRDKVTGIEKVVDMHQYGLTGRVKIKHGDGNVENLSMDLYFKKYELVEVEPVVEVPIPLPKPIAEPVPFITRFRNSVRSSAK